MYESYRYIRNKVNTDINTNDKQIDPALIMENKYQSISQLKDKCIVYSAGVGYRVYPNYEMFVDNLLQMPEAERVFHEVIFSNAQKLKFDIDADETLLNSFDLESTDVENLPTNLQSIDLQSIDLPNEISDDSDLLALINEILLDDTIVVAKTIENSTVLANDINYKKYILIFNTILQAIQDAFFVTYMRELAPANIIICESHGKSDGLFKYSCHIVINGYVVSDHYQAIEFTRKVASYLPSSYHAFLDKSVNKSLQNFRVPLCHKAGSDRVLQITSGHKVIDTLVTYTRNCVLLPSIVSIEENKLVTPDVTSDDARTVLQISSAQITDHVFKCQSGNMFLFTRFRPGLCPICNVIHETDNSALVCATPNVENPDIITVFLHCRRYIYKNGKDGRHFIILGEFMSEKMNLTNAGAKIGLSKDIMALIEKTNPNIIRNWVDKQIIMSLDKKNLFPVTTLFDNLGAGSKNIYSEDKLRPFELVDTLIVHAAMKMGKTKTLLEYIGTHFTDGLHRNVIRFISFRQTFSGNIKEKFPDFTLYSDVKGALTQARVIVQIESLWRLELSVDPPDLLILDECESIFEQFDSGLLRGNFNNCFAKFMYLLKYSKRVVLMDAGISDRTARILDKLRNNCVSSNLGSLSNSKIIYHHNTFKNAAEDKYYFTGDRAKWQTMISDEVGKNFKVACPMSSYREAQATEKMLRSKYPAKQIKLYSSETTSGEKILHFADVNRYWSEYDILLYTPTVTAGVSYEQVHFNTLYGYFTDQSCAVETCIQMIGRIRNVGSKLHYICIAAMGNNLATDPENIKADFIKGRNNLYKHFDTIGLTVEYDRDTTVKYHLAPYFHVWVENVRMRNISKNSFIKRFLHNISITDAKTMFLSDDVYTTAVGSAPYINGVMSEAMQELQVLRAESKAEIAELESRQLVAAPDITFEEFAAIKEEINAQKDVTADNRAAYERFKLRSDYKFSGPINDTFIKKYRDKSTRHMFKNYLRICADPNLDLSLSNIQAEELATHKYFTDTDGTTDESTDDYYGVNRDINHKFMFDKHRYAIGFLRAAGFNHITDQRNITVYTMLPSLKANYWDNMPAACRLFEIRTPMHKVLTNDTAMLNYLLEPVNTILYKMYGIKIGELKNDPGSYALTKQTLFTFSAAKSKQMPLITTTQKTGVV